MASILCIYGSTSGNTEMVVDKVVEVLCSEGHRAEAQRVEKTALKDLRNHDLYILAASTYGHGILQEHFIPFAQELKQSDLSGKNFVIIGLGNPMYDQEYHIESARILEKVIDAQGGKRIHQTLKVSKSPVPHLDTTVTEWAKEVARIMEYGS